MKRIKCLPASPGFAIGKAYLLSQKDSFSLKVKGEEALLLLEKAKSKLRENLQLDSEKVGEEEGDIFFSHMLLLEDPEIWGKVNEKIEDGKSLGEALNEVEDEVVSLFESLHDERFRSRADDIKDVMRRIKEVIIGNELLIPEDSIIVSEEILPSHIVEFERWKPKGFISSAGSPFSHSAILARAKGIPMLTSCQRITEIVRNGEMLILDGEKGEVIIEPSDRLQKIYMEKEALRQKEEREAIAKRHLPAITKEGKRIVVYANVGNPEEIEEAKKMGADGIGIFRTEFLLFQGEDALRKETHLRVYRMAGKVFHPKPVHIRLFDIGADKPFQFLNLPNEPNPALGLRGIRLLLKRKELLYPQLEAIIEAHEEYPNISIILPMVSFPEEVKEIKELVGEIPVGIMVETPACALCLSKMAKFCDFFSIGTNDLLQYTLAVDRAGKDVSELYNPAHPSLWRLIKIAVKEAKRYGKEIGVCGEIAGERTFIPRLIRIGVEHLSVSPRFVPIVKEIIRSLNFRYAED
ncbi:phosphoenolpyruvate--protein phosphotransferase [bacterium]|nr:phosphoenolpyruvate--protein phosphotransferase [bacterium]